MLGLCLSVYVYVWVCVFWFNDLNDTKQCGYFLARLPLVCVNPVSTALPAMISKLEWLLGLGG